MEGDRWLGVELAGYRVDALIGHGGMGVVYRATHLRLQRQSALKLLAAPLGTDAEYRRRFEREARLAASLDHSHIVPIYDAGYTQGVLYLAMRYIDGLDLATVIDNDAPMDVGRVCELLGGVADALDTAHTAGLVHRDVKPANVLVAAPGGSRRQLSTYLCDFGIAKHTAAGSALTSTGQFLGTLLYCAPEQIQGQPVDGRADQYALGCVAFHCLTGRVPFPAEEPSAVMFAHLFAEPPRVSAQRSELPAGVDDVIGRALAKQPTRRFADCATFIQTLRTAGAAATPVPPRLGPAVQAPPIPHTPSPPRTPVPGDHQDRTSRTDQPATTTRTADDTRAAIIIGLVAALAVVVIGVLVWTHGAHGTPTIPVTTIAVGDDPEEVAITPDGHHAYITNSGSNNVSVIDTASNKVTTIIPVGMHPRGVAITPDGHHAYITNSGSYSVSVIDTGSNMVTTIIPIRPFSAPHGVAITPDGHHAYIATTSSVSVIDTASNTVTSTIPTPLGPEKVAITPDGHYAYVTSLTGKSVLVIDTTSNTVITGIPVKDPGVVAITPDGKHAYITNRFSNSVSVIDTTSNTVTTTIPIGVSPEGVEIAPDGRHAYIATYKNVSVIDTTSNAVTTTIPIDNNGFAEEMAITPDGHRAYVITSVVISMADHRKSVSVIAVGG